MIGQLQNKFGASVHFHGGMGVVRKFFNSVVISLIMLMVNFSYAGAQVSLKDLSVNYNELRLDKGYSIIYDNPNAAAKLNEFKIKFYKDSTFVDETAVETFPANGTIIPYELRDSVIGFNKAELSIISLHMGNITDFPSSAASIIALNEPTEIKPAVAASTPTEPVNRPPIAQNTIFEIGATIDTLARSLIGQYSDPDGDILAVVETSKTAPPLSYDLSNNGTLTLTAPSVTGTYTIPYEVRDRKGASATAEVSIAVVFPKATASSLTQYIEDAEQLLSNIVDKKRELSNLPAVSKALIKRRENLLADNKSLESKASDPQLLTLKTDIAELTDALELSKNGTSVDNLLSKLGDLNTQSLALQDQLQALQSQNLEEGVDIRSFKAELTSLAGNLDALKNKENTLIAPTLLTLAQMENWESQYQLLKQKIPSSPVKWLIVALALLILGGVILWALKKPKPSPNIQTSLKKENEKDNNKTALMSFPVYVLKPEGDSFTVVSKNYPHDVIDYNNDKGRFDEADTPTGLLFKGSKLNPSKPAKLKSVTTVEDAYEAVGRVGFAQDGPAIGDDYSYGTAILIDKDKVMTNRHVFNKIYKRILDEEESFGIEFFGIKDSSDTEFYELTTKDVIIIENYDAVILTLANSVPATHRKPIKFSSKAPETYDESNILVIGYPAEPSSITDDVRREFNNDLVFGVKRFSAGRQFRHPQDIDNTYGIESHTSGRFSAKKTVFAICHNASTLAGNSGSAVICEETGELIGLHFGSDQFDRPPAEEAFPANVAHSGVFLSKSVTFVTSKAFETYLQNSSPDGTT